MKTLVLLSNEFPYGSWEPYLEVESKYYNQFDHVIICALQLRDEHAKRKRKLQVEATVLPVRYVNRIQYFIESIVVLGDRNFYKETLRLIHKKRLNKDTLISLVVYLCRAHHEARVIEKGLKNINKDNLVFYSYRFEYQPYVAILLKKQFKSNGKIIARAHGYDLYDERHSSNYIPLRETVLNAVDAVYICSEYGRTYLKNRYPEFETKIMTSYLGTEDHGMGPFPKENDVFRIVSCSVLSEVKRVERIVDALSLIKDIDIEWTHYGDGKLFDQVKQHASKMLGPNIKYIFKGNVDNSELMNEYKETPFNLFVNVSESEGIPVAIMEAISFGIPCVATNVGGTSEILCGEGFYILLDKDFKNEELTNSVISYFNMEKTKYVAQRKIARCTWNRLFNAEKNYTRFIKILEE